jgi:hypothetical protein
MLKRNLYSDLFYGGTRFELAAELSFAERGLRHDFLERIRDWG